MPVFVVPRMPAFAFEKMKSSSKSAGRLFELGLYPLFISLKASGVTRKRRRMLWDKDGTNHGRQILSYGGT